ncbi:Altered inheritance of mitochondria protein 9, mitochondrial [Penicillium subrubescens]|uniref:Altered inheritance of mitochondria protein 9, mitochondrial n=1 Tax=Penicillium subrubescens TaxID=1316194 RepID=A0A1Q5UDA4_9EURO|nr:Altered inheritance of mitochondria protein 9, mitochondrial [Penicillium subrubescens]
MKAGVGRRFLSSFCKLRSRAAQDNQLRTPALPSSRSFLTTTTLPPGRKSLAIRTIKTLSKQMPAASPDFEHFFRYTSGRWLWDEEQQLRDRYRAFNVAGLQGLAARAVGSGGCVSMTKLAEGGFNKVFRLVMDDGKSVLARIPNPNAGPSFYTTASEVATMEFARDFLQIPVPRVLGWDATTDNPAGSEYIFMEEATGTQLGMIWDELSPDSKLSIMREVVAIESKMLSVSFSHYGSIYFASDAVEGAVPAKLTNEAPSELKEHIYKTFSIGPTVDRGFWKRERASMDISRGPWSTPSDYALCVGQREMEWIKNYAVPKPPSDATLVSPAQNSPEAHLQLLEKYLKVAPSLMDIEPILTRPTLWHSDLHSSNLFVDDGRIASVIDWQGSWAGPLFLQAQPSPLVDYQDHGKTRRLPVELAGNTWDDDIVSFREALINVERYWHELGIQGDCPYRFTQAELHNHSVDADGWNEVQDFFDSIEGLVKRDGWTSPETFDAAFGFFSELRKRGLAHLKGDERDIFERQTRWAKTQADLRASGMEQQNV